MKQIHTKAEEGLRESAENLHENAQRYRILFEAATQGMLLVQDDQCKLLNPMLSELTGYSKE